MYIPVTSLLLETFGFDNEYVFEYEYDFFGATKFLTGIRKIVVEWNLAAVLLFITRVTEDLVVNVTSSKAKIRTRS